MKFAFSTVSCPKWDFETIVTRAREYGYDGVEVRAVGAESQLIFDNPARVQALFDAGGIKIVCLASSIAMQQGGRGWRFWRESPNDRSAAELRTYLDAARRLHCPLVKIFDTQVRPGQDRGSAGVALGDWLLPLADYAAERNVVIVIENALSFRSAKEMWSIL